MALIRCDECKAEVSDTADKCPQCGAVVGSQGINRWIKVTLALFALGVIVVQVTKLPV